MAKDDKPENDNKKKFREALERKNAKGRRWRVARRRRHQAIKARRSRAGGFVSPQERLSRPNRRDANVFTDFDLALPSGWSGPPLGPGHRAPCCCGCAGAVGQRHPFNGLADHLAGADRQLVAFDLRGCGHSAA